MRRDIARWGILGTLAVAIVVVAALVAGCHSTSGGSSSSVGGAAENGNLDTAKAVAVPVTKANGGLAHVDTAKGGVDIYIPPDAVSTDMQLVVTPLLKPEPADAGALDSGVSVVQKGHENQHIALTEPAFVSFTLPGKVNSKALVVSFPPGSSGEAYATSVVTTGGVSTVTAMVPGFTAFRVENPGYIHRWKIPRVKYDLRITGSVPNEKGPLRWFTTANGHMSGGSMMSGLRGDIDFQVEVWVHMGNAWAKGGTSKIGTTAEIEDTSFRTVNSKTGSFVYAAYGTAKGFGSVSERGTAEAEGISAGFAKNAAGNGEFPMVVTTSAYPVEGRPVPAKVAIWIGGRRYDFKGQMQNLGTQSWMDSP